MATKKNRLLVFGSINVDLVMSIRQKTNKRNREEEGEEERTSNLPRPGETVITDTYALKPGGKGANQALAAQLSVCEQDTGTRIKYIPGNTNRIEDDAESEQFSLNEVHVSMVGRTGDDGFASVATANLIRYGVDCSEVTKSTPGEDHVPTGCAAVLVDGDSGENQIVVGGAANLTLNAERHLKKLFSPRDSTNDCLLLLQMEAPIEEVFSAINMAHEENAVVVLNNAPAASIPFEVLRKVDVLIVNEHEAITTANGIVENETKYKDLGVGLIDDPRLAGCFMSKELAIFVIVTCGKRGALAFLPPGDWIKDDNGYFTDPMEFFKKQYNNDRVTDDYGLRFEVSSPKPEQVVDTVGAGDAFVGTFAASILSGFDIHKCLARASCAGSLACTKVGAQEALPTGAMIEKQLQNAIVSVYQWRRTR